MAKKMGYLYINYSLSLGKNFSGVRHSSIIIAYPKVDIVQYTHSWKNPSGSGGDI
jgi:hypothetical protein